MFGKVSKCLGKPKYREKPYGHNTFLKKNDQSIMLTCVFRKKWFATFFYKNRNRTFINVQKKFSQKIVSMYLLSVLYFINNIVVLYAVKINCS